MADRIGIINRGKLKQIGTLNELKSHLSPRKVVEVLLSYASDKWQEFRSVRNVTSVEELSPGRILLNLDAGADADEAINDVIQSIAKLKIKVRGVTLLSPSLDEIYLNYVQEADN